MHGIVIIEIYSYNKKVYTLYTVVMSHSYILPKCAKTREPKDKHCVSWCTYISYNMHNPLPLDNLKNHTALPYITLDASIVYLLFVFMLLLYCVLYMCACYKYAVVSF